MKRTAGRWRRLAPALLLAGAALLAAGCGRDDRPRLYAVRGTVLYAGQPTVGAFVFFHRDDASADDTVLPHAVVGADGMFRVGTYREDDGAPAGSYRVTVSWKAPGKGGDDDGKNLLPLAYLSPTTSNLRVQVGEGPTELPPFQLTK